MAPTLTTEVVPGPNPVVRVAGELDLSTAARLCRAIDAAVAAAPPRPRVVIDLTALTFCDSTGLRALVGAVREVEIRGGRAALAVAPDSMLDRLLLLTGLDEFCVTQRVEPGRLSVDERSFVI
jgi:anti-sigma B factor antagonist